MLTNNTVGIIFANMHDEHGGELTKHRSMGSLPFAGRYRLIDFVLSSFTACGIEEVVVVTKANYRSLMDHVGSGRAWDLSRKKQGLTIAPPLADGGTRPYHGKVEALANALTFVKNSQAEYFVLSDCNWVCNLSAKDMLDAHIKSGADITMACCDYLVDPALSKNSVTVECDGDDVTGVLIDAPVSVPTVRRTSMNVFVVNSRVLRTVVEQALAKGMFSLERYLLSEGPSDLKIKAYLHTGYARQIYNLISYYRVSMELLDPAVSDAMFNRFYPINTKVRDDAPVRYGLKSQVKNSFIADGCVIDGTVENSVLFRGVRVEEGAVVRNSILMQDSAVERDARLERVVADKNVRILSEIIMNGAESYPVFIEKGAVLE